MYPSFSSRGKAGRTKLSTMDGGTAMSVTVAVPLKVDKMDVMKCAAGSSEGPMGGRENFWRRAWAYEVVGCGCGGLGGRV